MPRLIEIFMKVGMLAAAGCFVASDAAMGQPISTSADSFVQVGDGPVRGEGEANIDAPATAGPSIAVRRRTGTLAAAPEHGATGGVRGLRESRARVLAERRVSAARLVPGQGLGALTGARHRAVCQGCLLRHAPVRPYLLLAASDEVAHRWPTGTDSRRRHDHQGAVSAASGPLQRVARRPTAQSDRLDDHDQGFIRSQGRLVLGRILRRDDVRRRQAAVSISVGGVRVVLPALPCDGGEGAYVFGPQQHPGISRGNR